MKEANATATRAATADRIARRMRELCDGEPTFRNLDVTRAEMT
ncbi:MAG: hypothetical protein ACRDPH_05335 [Marmoricola sp.]